MAGRVHGDLGREIARQRVACALRRSGHHGNVSYERMRYDTYFQCVVLQCMQTKVHKMKLVPLIVGFCRLSCWVLAWADEMVQNDKNVYQPGIRSFADPCNGFQPG